MSGCNFTTWGAKIPPGPFQGSAPEKALLVICETRGFELV